MWRKEINILRTIVHQVGFIYKIIQGCTINKTKKNVAQSYLRLCYVIIWDEGVLLQFWKGLCLLPAWCQTGLHASQFHTTSLQDVDITVHVNWHT